MFAQDYKELISHLENKADIHFYTNKDSTYYYYNKIYDLSAAHGDFITAIDNLNYLCESAGGFYDIKTIKETTQKIDSLVKKHKNILDTLPDKGDFQKNYLNFNIGNYYNKLEIYDQAEKYFQKIEQNIIQKADYSKSEDYVNFLSAAYSYIAKMNAVQYKFKVADDYYHKNIRLLEQTLPEDKESIYKVFNLYANSLYRQEKYQEAKNIWRRSFLYNISNYSPDNRNSLVSTGLLLSKVYSELNQLDSATYFLKKSQSHGIPQHFKHRYLTTLGDILAMKEENFDAESSLLQAVQLAPIVDKPLISKKLGNLFLKQKMFDQALVHYQNGLISMTNKFHSDSIFDNPLPNDVIQKQEFLKILRHKSMALNGQADLESYKANLKVIETGISTIDLLKPSFKNDSDKAFLIENAYPLIESGIEAVQNLYDKTDNQTFIDKAFFYAEKSKSVLLLEALLSAQATQFANIPNDVLEHESQLKSEITHIEKILTTTGNDDVYLEDDLFDLRQEYRALMLDIETNFPAYFDLKYNTEVLSLQEVQEKLGENKLLISYFYGNTNIYLIAASKNEKYLQKITNSPELQSDIKMLHAMLSNPKSDRDSLSSLSHRVYQKVLAPVIKLYPHENIIIVPDGLLNYIPFGSLVTNLNQNRYLIQDKTISYVNSASLWSQLQNKKQLHSGLLAFAPGFDSNIPSDDTRSGVLGNLPHNRKEVQQILTSFKGQSFFDDKATLQNFTSNVSEHSIIHLATHAVFDDKNPEYSYLAFTPNKDAEDILLVKDLYNLSLNASLVTLSACESAIGELKRGEGFLSLARGFFYSGASSISSTLWKINDNSSSELMGSFYENLADGNSKSQSLGAAKRSFLKKNLDNGLSHPYYWSGYIIQGNTQPLTKTTRWGWYLLGASLFVTLVLFRKSLIQLFK